MEKAKLADLNKLLAVLRDNGVLRFKMDGLELEIAPIGLRVEAPEVAGQDMSPAPEDKWSQFPVGELTPEQLQFYSAGGSPEEDPFREDTDS